MLRQKPAARSRASGETDKVAEVAQIGWGDDSLRIRRFQAAVRVSAHFYDALAREEVDGVNGHVDELNSRWLLLKGDQTVLGYELALQNELIPLQGKPIFDYVREQLGTRFSYDDHLWELNQKALREVGKCIAKWGGEKAKRRMKKLMALPLHCETGGQDYTEYSFERSAARLLLRAGDPKLVLLEAMLMRFSLFHEYLSHAFPSWQSDVQEISEGLLFALEFEWFESEYTVHDNDLIMSLWQQRLGSSRPSFNLGRWLLKRCSSRECMRKFLLEWVAGWSDTDLEVSLDLLSMLKGIHKKVGLLLAELPPKRRKILERVEAILCDPCKSGKWSITLIIKDLETELQAFKMPI